MGVRDLWDRVGVVEGGYLVSRTLGDAGMHWPGFFDLQSWTSVLILVSSMDLVDRVDVRYGGLGRYLGLGVQGLQPCGRRSIRFNASVSGGPVNVVCWRTFARLLFGLQLVDWTSVAW